MEVVVRRNQTVIFELITYNLLKVYFKRADLSSSHAKNIYFPHRKYAVVLKVSENPQQNNALGGTVPKSRLNFPNNIKS